MKATLHPRLNNLNDLIELLEEIDDSQDSDLGFDMQYEYRHSTSTGHPCGSACCIGGWVQVCNPETRALSIENALKTIAPDYDLETLHQVCYPPSGSFGWCVTSKQAADVLRDLIDNGKVSWESFE